MRDDVKMCEKIRISVGFLTAVCKEYLTGTGLDKRRMVLKV